MAQTIIVSNRLPVSVKKVDGKLVYTESAGGLATGLSAYAKKGRNIWLGWPGIVSEELNDQDRQNIAKQLKKRGCAPVFLSKKHIDGFYNGYSNSILWPLFHNLPLKIKDAELYWPAYKKVNQLFADVVASVSKKDSTIWVQDYQLMLVPEMLRARLTKPASIGFFLHIPFPIFKTYSRLPEARRIIRGILGADLVGFHTKSYTANFISNCRHLDFGIATDGLIALGGRAIRIAEFPIGIDYNKYARAMKARAVKKEVRVLKQKYHGYKIILAFDRFDISKGFIERLKAYGEFLKQNPDQHKKVKLVMIAAPSRTEVEAYKNLKIRVDKLVETINRDYGTTEWQPIDFIFRTMSFVETNALYQIADVAFITPIKDGMNLMAKEFVASQQKRSGVLILSETAGAAEELSDAILVNPKKLSTMVKGLEEAMATQASSIRNNLVKMQKIVSHNTAQNWAKGFINAMNKELPSIPSPSLRLTRHRQLNIANEYKSSRRRLIFLDYDGTLVDFSSNPGRTPLEKSLKIVLKKLGNDPQNQLVIATGRPQASLNSYLDGVQTDVASEHGAYLRENGKWRTTTTNPELWQAKLGPILQAYAEKTPGAWVERKKHSLTWHYRDASTYIAQKNLTILKLILRPDLKKYRLKLNQGKKIIEIKPPTVNKGAALKNWLKRNQDFRLIIGDDYTDEDAFKAAPDGSFTIKVGNGLTSASYRLKTPKEVAKFLSRLVG